MTLSSRVDLLVDYSNVVSERGAEARQEMGRAATQRYLRAFFGRVALWVTVLPLESRATCDIHIRFYGGWTQAPSEAARGQPYEITQEGKLLADELPEPYRSGSLRLIPQVATTTLWDNHVLIGTLSSSRQRGWEQKMVDSMIGVDAIQLAYAPPRNAVSSAPFVAIMSNDRDMIPFCLAANRIRPGTVRLVRRGSPKEPNERALRSTGILIESF